MKRMMLILMSIALFAACSSDNEENEPKMDKTKVTAKEIVGSWEYNETNNIRHLLIFAEDDTKSTYTIYRNNEISRMRYFNYSIKDFTLYLEGGAIATDVPMNETEIYKKGEKLYFNNMPFTSYKSE